MPPSSHGALDPGEEFGKVNMKHMKPEKKNTGNSDKRNQRERKKKSWHVGMGVLCLCYCSYIMLYLKNNASWFRVFHMDPVVVTSGCVRLRVLF